MTRIQVVGRRGRGRCAYCRESLGDDEGEACAGCGVTLHRPCRRELGGCPTIGCAEAAERTVRQRTELREERRQRRERPHARGRVTRTPPGLFARLGPYSRMAVRTLWHVAVVVGMAVAIVWGMLNPGDVVDLGKKSPVFALFVPLMGLFFGWLAFDWLSRMPDFWARVGELLDDGRVTPMHFATYTVGSGKSTQTWVRLTADGAQMREFQVDGILPPIWLTWRDGQTVFVHGDRQDEPCLLEFPDGTLALLDSGSD